MTLRFAFLELATLGWRAGAPALGLVCALWPRAAAAQSLPLDLSWHAPADCPQRDAVLSRAQALLGAKAAKAGIVRADGTIERRDEGFELTLLIDEGGKGGERKVWARQCEELSGAAAITLVLLLTNGARDGTDGSGLAAGTGSAAGPPEQPPPAPPKPTEPPSDVFIDPKTSASERSWHVLVAGPQLAFGVGPLPKPTLGLGAGVGVQGVAWSLRLLGQWFSNQAVSAPVQPYGADVKRMAVGLWGCWDLQRQAWSFSPCLQGSVSYLRAAGFGPYLRPATQSETTFGVGAGVIGRLHAQRWVSLMVSAGVQVELSRPVIVLGSVGTVRQLAPASAILQLGPEWIF